MAITIELTEEEITWAKSIGVKRQQEAIKAGKRDKHGNTGERGQDDHEVGAYGELAATKALGLPWDASVNTYKHPDLADIIQVRTRRNHFYGQDMAAMIVRKNDSDDEIFVQVTGSPSSKHIVHGWLFGKEAKQQQWLQKHGGREAAYFVPVENLRDIKTLIECLVEEGLVFQEVR